jgi:hypothetical protein
MRALVRILLAIISLLYGCVGGKAASKKFQIQYRHRCPFTALVPVPYLKSNIVPWVTRTYLVRIKARSNKKAHTMLVQRVFLAVVLAVFLAGLSFPYFFFFSAIGIKIKIPEHR